MALNKEQKVDKIEVVGNYKLVQVRTVTLIYEDGNLISKNFHRHVLTPNDDISEQDSEVQAICNAVWTDEIRTAYTNYLISSQSQFE